MLCIARRELSTAVWCAQDHAEDEDVDFVHMMAERMTQRVYKRGEIVYHKGDAAFVAISYSLVLAYACVGTATRAAPLRLLVGAAGVALTALATLAALGLTALAGVPVTPMTAQVSAYAAPDSSPQNPMPMPKHQP